jgi:hypothetical protein
VSEPTLYRCQRGAAACVRHAAPEVVARARVDRPTAGNVLRCIESPHDGPHGVLKLRNLTILLALLALGACTSVQGLENDPAEHRMVVTASGYTLDGCQAKMDELAGTKVQMVGHTDQVGVSAGSLFIIPAYTCRGFVQEPQAPAPTQAAPAQANPAAAAK